ncbi:hypothetical protein [Undibacterium luofuense]|uniref:hypothetical protein n=1 Tax=Undibacterium luofuense TaxID=2828733 RepID=UPI0030EE2A2F
MTSRQILFFAVALLSAPARAAEPQTWCASAERELFSCTFSNKKVASLCATPDWTRSSGSLQYRFGKPQNPEPEMTYPATGNHSANFRAMSSDLLDQKGNERSVWLSFQVGKYRYVIQDFERQAIHRQIIKVVRDETLLQTLVCDKNTSLLSRQREKILYLLDEDEFDER